MDPIYEAYSNSLNEAVGFEDFAIVNIPRTHFDNSAVWRNISYDEMGSDGAVFKKINKKKVKVISINSPEFDMGARIPFYEVEMVGNTDITIQVISKYLKKVK